MIRFLSVLLSIMMAAYVFAGCSQGKPASADDKLSVVTTIFPQYDFVREIAGDNAELTMLLPPGSESHSFEPAPRDIMRIRDCDVFIYVGGESEEWIEKILESIDTSKVKLVALMDIVEPVEEEIVEGMEEEHEAEESADEVFEKVEEEEDHVEFDEHVWTSPANAKIIVKSLSDVLCSADPENASQYKTNTESYLSKLDELDKAFREAVDNGNRKTLVFGDRFPFRYFADAYGLDYYAAFPGCSTETEPSAATVAFLIEKVKAEKIPVVFHIEFSNGKIADAVSEAANAKKLMLHSCHNVSRDDFEKGVSYLELMSANAAAVKEALK